MPTPRKKSAAEILRRLATPLETLPAEKVESETETRRVLKTQLPAGVQMLLDDLELPAKDLAPGFEFAFVDMEGLLKAYYFGGGRQWLSNLHKQDMSPKGRGARAILYDPAAIPYGNPLLATFSHRQVDHAIRRLAERSTVRAGQNRKGWLEYCLRVRAGRTQEGTLENATMPKVRDEDVIQAMRVLSQELAPFIDHIDKPKDRLAERLPDLFKKLMK